MQKSRNNANFSDHNAIKIKISRIGKSKINWKLNNLILQDQLVKEQIIETITKFMEVRHPSEYVGCNQGGTQKEIYTPECIY